MEDARINRQYTYGRLEAEAKIRGERGAGAETETLILAPWRCYFSSKHRSDHGGATVFFFSPAVILVEGVASNSWGLVQPMNRPLCTVKSFLAGPTSTPSAQNITA